MASKRVALLFMMVIAVILAGCSLKESILPPDATAETATGQSSVATEVRIATEVSHEPVVRYEYGSGEVVTSEMLSQIEAEDPNVAIQMDWLNKWRDWYLSADPSVRPISPETDYSFVYYKYTDPLLNVRYRVGLEYGDQLVMPMYNRWRSMSLPSEDKSEPGHGIDEYSVATTVETECVEGSELAALGVPVGAKLEAEAGFGAFVMVYQEKPVAKFDNGKWWLITQREFPEQFEPVNSGSYMANIYGLEIPVFTGVMESMTIKSENNSYPVRMFGPGNQDGINYMMVVYIQSCRYRFNMQNGTNLTSDEYVDLLKHGGGQFELASNGANGGSPIQMRVVEPLEGFTLIWASPDDPVVPAMNYGMDYLVDRSGRFFLVQRIFAEYMKTNYPGNDAFLRTSIVIADLTGGLSGFAAYDNDCILRGNGRIESACGMVGKPPEIFGIYDNEMFLALPIAEKYSTEDEAAELFKLEFTSDP